jgi:diguanylate cyclase (GGDEF)-like protein
MRSLHKQPANITAHAPPLNESHNSETWNKCVLIVVVLGGGSALLMPMISTHLWGGFRFPPQAAIGILILAVFYQHLLSQRKMLREISTALVTATSYVNRLEQFSFVDPQTQLFNRRYLDHLFNQQLKWLNRNGKTAALVVFDVLPDNRKSPAEEMVVEAAFILRSNFRGSDYVVRNSTNQFLVLLPDTNEDQARIALNRLTDKIEAWNLENEKSEMVLRQELSTCPPGGNLWQILQETEDKLRKGEAAQARRASFQMATVRSFAE